MKASNPGLASRPPVPFLWFVIGLGVLCSGLAFLIFGNWESREVARQARDLAEEQVEHLRVTTLRSMEVLHSLGSLHAVEGRMDDRLFSQFVQSALARQPELQALSWNPRIPHAARAMFEAKAGLGPNAEPIRLWEQGEAEATIRAGARPEYIPVSLIEPLTPNAAALGYDLGSDPERRRSLEAARDSGEPVTTAPIELAQDPRHGTGFLVLLPVYDLPLPDTVVERRERLAGFAVAVFRVDRLVGDTFERFSQQGLKAALFDQSPGGQPLHGTEDWQIGHLPPSPAPETSVVWLDVPGRRWALAFQPTDRFYAARSGSQSWMALAGGLLLTVLAAGLVFNDGRHTRSIARANRALQREVTVRQRAEAVAAAANRAKSDFLASMSHEIRTPLNAILGYTQLMRQDRSLAPEQLDAVHGISASGRHLLGLINEILDLSKIEAGRMEVRPVDFDMATLIQELSSTFRPLCAQKRIGLRVQFSGDEPSQVRGDEGKLRQVLINLLGNAVKFTQAGEVILQCRRELNGRWLFEVIDTGLGIPESERASVFQPFHQSQSANHQGGTGLGLAIARRQVELLGGTLELESERGIGSRFFFHLYLPPALAWVSEEPVVDSVHLPPGREVRVLVVDDNHDNRFVLSSMLSRIGCTVLEARGGGEALAMARSQPVDVVFLDLILPDGSGTEVAAQLGQRCGQERLKVIMNSASALPSRRQEALDCGCTDFLSKPLSAARVYECLERQLGLTMVRHGPEATSDTASASPPPDRILLPEPLCARLSVAAELHSTTALKSCLAELRQRDAPAQWLAEQIRGLMRSFDMNAIQKLMHRVESSPSSLQARPESRNHESSGA